MGVYIGCDYHPQQQTLAWMDTEEGVIHFSVLEEQRPEQVLAFFREFPPGTIIGMEATGACDWFELVVAEAGHVAGRGCEEDPENGAVAAQDGSARRGTSAHALAPRPLSGPLAPAAGEPIGAGATAVPSRVGETTNVRE